MDTSVFDDVHFSFNDFIEVQIPASFPFSISVLHHSFHPELAFKEFYEIYFILFIRCKTNTYVVFKELKTSNRISFLCIIILQSKRQFFQSKNNFAAQNLIFIFVLEDRMIMAKKICIDTDFFHLITIPFPYETATKCECKNFTKGKKICMQNAKWSSARRSSTVYF